MFCSTKKSGSISSCEDFRFKLFQSSHVFQGPVFLLVHVFSSSKKVWKELNEKNKVMWCYWALGPAIKFIVATLHSLFVGLIVCCAYYISGFFQESMQMQIYCNLNCEKEKKKLVFETSQLLSSWWLPVLIVSLIPKKIFSWLCVV